jgi:predicted RNA binding protein YcfA (HicA-like mRNA interferase family)
MKCSWPDENSAQSDGADFAAALVRGWDYVHVHQTGSHIIIETEKPFHQRLSVPAHKPLKAGTLNVLVRMAADHKQVSKQDILKTL